MFTLFHLLLLLLLLPNGAWQNTHRFRETTIERIWFLSSILQKPKNVFFKKPNVSAKLRLGTQKEKSLTSSKDKNNLAQLPSDILEIYGRSPIGAQKAFFSSHSQKYPLKDFPLNEYEFKVFRNKTQQLLQSKKATYNNNNNISLVDSQTYNVDGEDLTYQFYLVKLETGEISPMIHCINNSKENQFAFLVSPGHSNSPLLDIISNSDSYQKAIGTKLCRLGYPVVATEKN